MSNNEGVSVISWLAVIISLKSVLELINFSRNGQVQDTGWQSGGGKVLARALSLLAMEPAFDRLFLFGVFFYGDPDPWIHSSSSPANRNAGQIAL